ncbi:LTA synthase family protein [Gracilibacillus dipsosauri]|uniref:LTA synthase family protein n=1 Tax=Gracilibacillus dipsosauri TaxID=178340 RepID=UPI002409F4F4
MDQAKKFFKSYFFFFIIAISLKIILARYMLFTDTNVWNTIWYELTLVLILLALIELINKGKLILYIVVDVLITFILFGSVVYERYFGTIPTYLDLGQMNQVGTVSDSALLLIGKKDLLIFLDFFILTVLLLLKKFVPFPRNISFSRLTTSIILIVSLLITGTNVYMNRTDKVLDQALLAKESGIFNSQLIKGYSTIARAYNIKHFDITVEDIIKIKGNEPVPFEDHKYYGLAEGRNLIVIQIESLQDFVLGLTVNGQEVTPNLNKWADESFYFTNVFQQIGAGNTSDAEFILNTSIYPVGDTPTSSVIEDKDVTSLPKVLKNNGYHSATFHADEITYWDRHILYPALGFDEYYDIEYYGEHEVIGFGPSDEYFYGKTMDKLVEFKKVNQPFYANVLSITSHTPFEMPEDKQFLDLPEEIDGTFIGNYLQSVRYADHALGLLFEDLKEQGIWDNSIIALYGDHSGVHGRLLKDEDVKILKDLLGGNYSLLHRFNIPFIVGIPGVTEDIGERIHVTGGQLDMMPTILNLMGIKPEGLYFGHNLLQYEHNLIGMRYYLSAGAFFNDEILYIPETARFGVRTYDLKGTDKDIMKSDEYYKEYYDKMLQIYEWSDLYFESLTKE